MKEGWEYKKLGDCFISINNGANIRQVKGAKGIPVTRIETLSNDKFNRERMGYADILDASPYSSYILNDGDILMSHINSMKFLGRAVQYSKKENETIIHGMNLLRLVPTKDVLSSFLVYQFYTAFFRNQIVSISHQSVNQASFNTTNLKNLKLKVPPLSEQQSIVDYLDSAFAKIDAMKANAEKALNEAKALFQASLKEMLEPKEGWEEKTIGEVCLLKSGNSDANNSKQGSLPYVKVGDMNLKGNETYITVSSTYVDRQENIKNIFPIGTLIFPKRGGAIFTNKKRLTEIEICCDLNIMGVIPNKNSILPLFLYYFFNTIDFKIFKDEGASIPQINNKNIAPIMIYLPSLFEQQSIVATLDSLKSKVDRLQENYNKISQECDALKQAILRQVFE